MRWFMRHPEVTAAIVLVLTVILTTVLRPVLAPDFEARADEARDRVQAATDQVVRKVAVTFTSDPSGATVFVSGEEVGTTPVTAQFNQNRPTGITVVGEEPFEEYDLYKPFQGFITATRSENNISVWLDRTSAEEQAAMQEAWAALEQERLAEERRNTASPENFVITEFDAEWNAVGVLWVTATVRNDGNVPAGVQLRAEAYDLAGEVVDTVHFWPASVVNIPPGGVEQARYPVSTDEAAQFVELDVAQARAW